MNTLNLFRKDTACWFAEAFQKPTAVQDEAWPPIADGNHTLVSAPTGTGKTLAAFLVYIDRLVAMAQEGNLAQELHLIYVSPLKSLAGDIRENLRRPLEGILSLQKGTGPSHFPISVAVRTGDTTQAERRAMIKRPPHILITTPESLYLMLTSKSGRNILRTARWAVIDELHALIDSKRGAHLMLSLARLDALCPKPLQRVGLSATIEPLDEAAAYLSPDPVTIVAPKMRKQIQIVVTSPDFKAQTPQKDAAWRDIAASVFRLCKDARSVIAFLDGRAYAEKLAFYVNQIAGEGFARTHHGSISKEKRLEVERALRSGELRLLCATSSMELGIDVGEIDEVFQVGCPRTISGTMQRLGRSGHNPDRVSVMRIFARASAEGLYSGLAAEVVRRGGIERSRPPRSCLDVLAQHLVSMATAGSYSVKDVMRILPRAHPFREVTRQDVKDVLCMLAGDYEHDRDIPVRPRLLYDRVNDRVEGDAYSRMLATSAGGTIPDKGLYDARTEGGVKIGELDEEFVFEARIGDRFLLGTFAWQIVDIKKDRVMVTPSSAVGAKPPFWKGEIRGRRLETAVAYGEILRNLAGAEEAGTLFQELTRLGLDDNAADGAADFLRRQIAVTGTLPDDRTVLVEHFKDENGIHQMMFHSLFGRPVNEPLAILAAEAARRVTGGNVGYVVDDDGFVLYPYGDSPLPERLLFSILPESAGPALAAALPATPLYNMVFRYNAARALMMGVRKAGRQPLWVQRLRSSEMLDSLVRLDNHPLIRESRRECLEDHWDLEGARMVLGRIRSGGIRVVELHTDSPSPMSLPFRHRTEGAMMYNYAPTPPGIHVAVEEALDAADMIAPAASQLARPYERAREPVDPNALHSLLMTEGDMTPGEANCPAGWFAVLQSGGRAKTVLPGLWIAAEHSADYEAALTRDDMDGRMRIVRRFLRYRGARSAEQIANRYSWSDGEAIEVLRALSARGNAVLHEGLYYHAAVFARAQRDTVRIRRAEIKTLPPQRYAAMMARRARLSGGTGTEALGAAFKTLFGLHYPAPLWEGAILPARVPGYRPNLLDSLLAQGSVFWRIAPDLGLAFHPQEELDWDGDDTGPGDSLSENELAVLDALRRKGASFTQRLSGLLGGAPLHDALLGLVEKGLVHADSFTPVRVWLNSESMRNASIRQKSRARVMTLMSGRWELSRPLKELTIEQKLERAFDRGLIVSRETAEGLPWVEALKLLRLWEYTGRVRRGYFVEGLSGMQYVRDGDFAGVSYELEQPGQEILWLPAVDPCQAWGKILPHSEGKGFLNVPGTAVALKGGIPVAIFERQGKTLRVFEPAALPESLRSFALDYRAGRLFPMTRRLTVKEYPDNAVLALKEAGFAKDMTDYVLYRGYN